jgi:hypothetical protein
VERCSPASGGQDERRKWPSRKPPHGRKFDFITSCLSAAFPYRGPSRRLPFHPAPTACHLRPGSGNSISGWVKLYHDVLRFTYGCLGRKLVPLMPPARFFGAPPMTLLREPRRAISRPSMIEGFIAVLIGGCCGLPPPAASRDKPSTRYVWTNGAHAASSGSTCAPRRRFDGRPLKNLHISSLVPSACLIDAQPDRISHEAILGRGCGGSAVIGGFS